MNRDNKKKSETINRMEESSKKEGDYLHEKKKRNTPNTPLPETGKLGKSLVGTGACLEKQPPGRSVTLEGLRLQIAGSQTSILIARVGRRGC